MVVPFDNLDSMMWTVGISAALIGILLLKLRYNATTDMIEETVRRDRLGFSLVFGGAGIYLLLGGLFIGFTWPFGSPYGTQYQPPNFTGAYANVLFGGIAIFGGLLLIVAALALYFNGGFRIVSYLGAGIGFYALTDAAAVLIKGYTKTPLPTALGYIGLAAAAFFILPVTHSNNRALRYVAAVFAFLFAAVWLFEGFNTTMSHLGVPVF